MTTITILDKSFEMKDTMLVKETKKVMQTMAFAQNFIEKIKNSKPEELMSINTEIQNMTQTQWNFVYGVVQRCYGLANDQIDELHNIDMIQLFSEVYQESTILKKN